MTDEEFKAVCERVHDTRLTELAANFAEKGIPMKMFLELAADVRWLVDYVEELRREYGDEDKTRRRLEKLLRGVADALKGPQKELQWHSWHDLPELAAAAVKERDDARTEAAAATLVIERLQRGSQ